ncbi:ATP-binding cassette domain-containing protein [Micromonospora sp. WMMA1947]|uniref:ATP-binding cassette domain-containing protein n=1 Tax=Micromonospora sp. WMMA1947 TaxID=3015163 RepID=UPI00248A9B27|nr:ATP-binding cassette domain-containing protein [Micromonospora sp. WMMA1947]WBC07465.1 ATP-binding cassette domain-containing protein [Micromonospora sp. WMMA1947]
MSVIELHDLRKMYPDDVVALDGLTFDVSAGEIFGCLGRNGAGKTTTVRILTALTRPTSGSVQVLGLDPLRARRQIQAQVGVSLQQAALDQLMTGREHLVLMARLRGLGAVEGRKRTDALLERFGLGTVADRYVATYTIGMQRRLDTAMALLHEPTLLFLDEPTTGLDPQSRRALWSFVSEFRADGGTVFLTTQYLDEADQLCDRIAILDHGRVSVLDTPSALKRGVGGKTLRVEDARPEHLPGVIAIIGEQACRMDDSTLDVDLSGQEELLPDVLAGLRRAGVPMARVDLVDPSIEEVFVRLTGEGVDTRGLSEQAAGVAAIGRTLATGRKGGAR